MRIIAGEARGRQISAPAGRKTRPTLDRIRENMFNILQPDIPGSRVLDLFAGSGALSLESLSRGAESAVLVDSDRNASAVQTSNIESLGYNSRTRQFRCDWTKAVRELTAEGQVFDVVFLDPPYAMLDMREVFHSLIPLITPDTLIVLEHEAGKTVLTAEGYSLYKDRAWGFCGVSIYRYNGQGV